MFTSTREVAGINLGRSEYIRIDPRELSPGEVLPRSRQWRNEEPTDRLLAGTCCLDPRRERREPHCSYEGQAYVVRGRVIRRGQDDQEVILRHPVVVRVV